MLDIFHYSSYNSPSLVQDAVYIISPNKLTIVIPMETSLDMSINECVFT